MATWRRRLSRVLNCLGGALFIAAGLGCTYLLVVSNAGPFGLWDWIWRVGGTVLLLAAGVGLCLPDSPAGPRLHRDQESTVGDAELPQFPSPFDRMPSLAPVIAALQRMDPGPAHTIFHTSEGDAWGLRTWMVRLCHDRYVTRWDPLASSSMMRGVVARTNRDPFWLLVAAYYHARGGRLHEALKHLQVAATVEPRDPTPYVIELFALRDLPSSDARTQGAWVAHARAMARCPGLFEAHEQLLHVLATGVTDEESASDFLCTAETLAKASSVGSDARFLPGIATAILVARSQHASPAPLTLDQVISSPEVERSIDRACRDSFDAPGYSSSHRTYRLLHTAAALHTAIGNLARVRAELERTDRTFDPDIWSILPAATPAEAFLQVRRTAGVS